MSASEALIRFNKSGNIYCGCYEGTSDILIPFICTPEECYMEDCKAYSPISYCRKLQSEKLQSDNHYFVFPEFPDVDDLDEVEIYSDYGGGFFWDGVGSESAKRIKYPLAPFEHDDMYPTDGCPEWAEEFFKARRLEWEVRNGKCSSHSNRN